MTEIPEDLESRSDAEQRCTPLDRPPIPEDMSGSPDAPPVRCDSIPKPSLGPIGAIAKPGSTVALFLAVVTLLLFIWLEAAGLVLRAFATHPGFGWATVGFSLWLVAMLAVFLFSQARKYGRHRKVVRLQRAYSDLSFQSDSEVLNSTVQDLFEAYLAQLERSHRADVREPIIRLRKRIDMVNDAREWREDIERLLLGDLDRRAHDLIHKEAINVAIGTAISPYVFLDATVTSWRNLRLIGDIAALYGARPGAIGTLALAKRTVGAVVTAGLTERAMDLLLPLAVQAGTAAADLVGRVADAGAGAAVATGHPEVGVVVKGAGKVIRGAGSAGARTLAPLSQGLLNAMLTIRLGIATMEACRPLPLGDKHGESMLRELFGAVRHAARRAIAHRVSKKDGTTPEPASRTEADGSHATGP